jgi:antitoxin ParD1/3/4
MPTRNIVLPDALDSFVRDLIESGRYKSASEVMREGLRLMEDRMARRDAELEQIREGVLTGIEQANAGDFAEGGGQDVVRRVFARARETKTT